MRQRSHDPVLRGGGWVVLIAPAIALGCGTTLQVRSIVIPREPLAECKLLTSEAEQQACRSFNEPGGIVLNQRMRYRIAVEAPGASKLKLGDSPPTLAGVDQERLLVVGYTREPFASGTLALTLDDAQTVQTIAIQSRPGELQLIQSLGELTSARREVRDAEQKKKADEAKAKQGQ